MDALLRRRAMIAAGESPTPPTPGLVFYDRLVFDGTVYIDTDIVPPENASFRLNLGRETTKGAQRILQAGGANSALFGVLMNPQTTTTYRMFNVYYGQSSYVSQSNISTRVGFSYDNYVLFITPYKWGVGGGTATFTKGNEVPTSGIILGSNIAKSGNPYTGAMGYVRIYGSDAQNATDAADLLNNFTPVYTLRPCTYDGEPGVWCEETSSFYGNTAGAGTLSVLND